VVNYIPELNSIKSAGRIVKLFTEISGFGLLAQRPMQPYKHIARIDSVHSPGKKSDIFLADRTRV
jgi:hypothetical protein